MLLLRPLFRVVARFRPGIFEGSAAGQTIFGWLLRFTFFPALRGVIHAWRFESCRLPIFVGRRPSIFYAGMVSLGQGAFLGDGIRINAFSAEGVRIGRSVTIRENGWIQCSSSPQNAGVGLFVGDRTYIGPSVIIGVGGAIKIGEDCQFGSGVTLISENHVDPMPGDTGVPVVSRRGISIGRGVWLGHRVTILDGVTLGDYCVVGAGAVVTKSFAAGSRIAGVPARSLAN